MSRRGRDANMPTHQLREVHRLTHVLVGEGHLGGEAVPEGGVAVHIIHGDKGTGRFMMRGCSWNNTVRSKQVACASLVRPVGAVMILPESTIDVPIVRLQKLHGPLSERVKKKRLLGIPRGVCHVASSIRNSTQEFSFVICHLSHFSLVANLPLCLCRGMADGAKRKRRPSELHENLLHRHMVQRSL